MTSKTKRWIPPVIPLRDDLVVWKALFNDLHDNLIDAGLVQTDDTGQLDIDTVAVLPADSDFAGYRIYRFDDALATTSPVYIKLRFGCGAEGIQGSSNTAHRTRFPRIHCTVSNAVSDGNGELSGETVVYGSPQLYNRSGSNTTNNEHYGTSYYCRNDDSGFFGFLYGVGSRNKPFASTSGNYHGATFSLVIQRSSDAVGNPTPDGIMVMGPGIDSSTGGDIWGSGVLEPAKTQYLSGGTVVPMTREGAIRVAGNESSVIESDIYLQPVFTPTPLLKQWTTLVTYRTQDIAEGTEFTLEVVPGQPRNFIALGNETSMSVDAVVGHRAAFAMLFE